MDDDDLSADARDDDEARRRLVELLDEAGIKHFSKPEQTENMVFNGRYREWLMRAKMTAEWLHVFVPICKLPSIPGLRYDALLWMARANSRLAGLKYSLTPTDQIVIEMEARSATLDAPAIHDLLCYLYQSADEDYLSLVRTTSGDARLEGLSKAFDT